MLAPTGGGEVLGEWRTGSTNRSVWELAQWNSRHPFTNSLILREGAWSTSNKAQWISWQTSPEGTQSVLTLGMDSRELYAGRFRTNANEPWAHLLLQQTIVAAPPLSQTRQLRLRVEARLLEAESFREVGYDPRLHAAQFQIVVTLNNTRRNSPGFGDYLWFVVPLYDDRYDIPPEYVAPDFAVTHGKLIYNPGGAALGVRRMTTGEWAKLDCDLRPWLERALETAWKRGYLRDSTNPSDYSVAHINAGWEVPGLSRVSMQLRGLSLTVTYKP